MHVCTYACMYDCMHVYILREREINKGRTAAPLFFRTSSYHNPSLAPILCLDPWERREERRPRENQEEKREETRREMRE